MFALGRHSSLSLEATPRHLLTTKGASGSLHDLLHLGPGIPSLSSVTSPEYSPSGAPTAHPTSPAAGEGPDCQNGREVKTAPAQKSGLPASQQSANRESKASPSPLPSPLTGSKEVVVHRGPFQNVKTCSRVSYQCCLFQASRITPALPLTWMQP